MNSNALFSDMQLEQMADEVLQVLGTVGYLVEHPKVKALALKAGCRESAEGRVLFDRKQVAELRTELERQYPPAAGVPSWVHPPYEFTTSFGNLTPKFYDYANGRPEIGSRERMLELVRFAQAEPRITMVTLPLSRQDVEPTLEQLESVVLMAGVTSKTLGNIDVTVPETVPFLAEMGEVLGQAPGHFVGYCNCINPPLRLEERTAETMLQRSRYHSRSMITSMPCLGGSGPVDIHGAVVLATAEIVGGLILSRIIDPLAPLLGYIACVQLDMRTGNPSSSTPQTVRFDAGVYQLMKHAFGGGTAVGGRSYITAKRPGLQATYERFLKAVGFSALVDRYDLRLNGSGNLDNGSMISPEQFLLDCEMTEGLIATFTAPVVSPAGDTVARIRDGVLNAGGNFMTQEHTLEHYRDEMWDPQLFRRLGDTRTEQEVLDACHAKYLQTLATYQPAAHPAPVVHDLEKILARARKTLLK